LPQFPFPPSLLPYLLPSTPQPPDYLHLEYLARQGVLLNTFPGFAGETSIKKRQNSNQNGYKSEQFFKSNFLRNEANCLYGAATSRLRKYEGKGRFFSSN
jgi:hypothetical protein